MKRLTITIILLIQAVFLQAAQVDTIAIYSQSMDKNVKNVVIVPDGYATSQKHYNVLYLLHGAYGCHLDWITKVPQIAHYSDQYNLIIVCPDGYQFGWYLDSPINPKNQYETYFSKELVTYIDQHYRTRANRKHRAITGLSMGGHGALLLACKHQDIWGAAGSMSGALNLNSIKNRYELDKLLGNYKKNPERWTQNSVLKLIENLTDKKTNIIIDCGVDDFLFKHNIDVHKKLTKRKISHTFITRPGAHSWDYWANAIQYHLIFFNNYFNRQD